jgi:hypothetical protein
MNDKRIKRAIEAGPYRLKRVYSNGCEVCPEIWLGHKWVATLAGAPHLGHDSLEAGCRIVFALNAVKHLDTADLERGILVPSGELT